MLKIRIFKKLYLLFLICKKAHWKCSEAFPHLFASNSIAQYTEDSAEQLKAADTADYVVINTVTLPIMPGIYEQPHYSALISNTLHVQMEIQQG